MDINEILSLSRKLHYREFEWVCLNYPQYIEQLIEKIKWEEQSYIIAYHCPKYIKKFEQYYDWKNQCWAIARYCPNYLNKYKDLYNWEKYSFYISLYTPEYILKFKKYINFNNDDFWNFLSLDKIVDKKLREETEQFLNKIKLLLNKK